MGLAIGVVTSAMVIGMTVLYMHKVFGIGSAAVAAPQATLMATLIKGLLSQNLPWGLVLIGVFVAVTLELCGVHSLSFAVGAYLPIATTAPIFAGGVVRWWVDRKTGATGDSDLSAGTLFSSGLIAGGSLAGILFAVLVGLDQNGYHILPTLQKAGDMLPAMHGDGTFGQIASGLLFFALAVILAKYGQRKI
jgi:uncharacterized oligopeptide transporter (OPT) family protein